MAADVNNRLNGKSYIIKKLIITVDANAVFT